MLSWGLVLKQAMSYKPVFGLNLPHVIQGTANHFKASCPAPTKTSSESKNKNDIWCDLVHFGWFFQNFWLRYCCLSRVKDINDHFFHWSSLLTINFLVCIFTVLFMMVAPVLILKDTAWSNSWLWFWEGLMTHWTWERKCFYILGRETICL